MALQTIAGKFYNVKFSKISQSSTIEGETFFDVRKHTSQIPHRFLRGKSSVEKGGFFDVKLITSADHLKIIKLDNQFNYLGLRFDLFKTMMNSFIVSQSSSPSASVNMSSSFFAPGKFGSLLSDSDYITLIEEEMDIHGYSYLISGLPDGEAGLAQIREEIRSKYKEEA
mgnify:CR=1 FL=1